jgi:hypothetical protein
LYAHAAGQKFAVEPPSSLLVEPRSLKNRNRIEGDQQRLPKLIANTMNSANSE